MKLLWIYTALVICVVVLGCFLTPFFPPEQTPIEQQIQESVFAGIFLFPAAVFIVIVGINNLRSK